MPGGPTESDGVTGQVRNNIDCTTVLQFLCTCVSSRIASLYDVDIVSTLHHKGTDVPGHENLLNSGTV